MKDLNNRYKLKKERNIYGAIYTQRRSGDSNRGGANQSVIDRISDLEKRTELMEGRTATTEKFGMAKISDSESVTEQNSGLVLSAREKNSSADGSIMNRVSNLTNQLRAELNNIKEDSQFLDAGNIERAGWYRIVKYRGGNLADAHGATSNGCIIVLKRVYSNDDNEYHRIELVSTYMKQTLKKLTEQANTLVFTSIRYTVDTRENTAYIEVMYGSNNANICTFSVSNARSWSSTWKLIAPELTRETVSGVEVRARTSLSAG